MKSNVESMVAQPSRSFTTFALALVTVGLIVGLAAYLTLSPMGKTTTTLVTYAPDTTTIVSATNSSAGQLGTWSPTTAYPFAGSTFSCVSSGSYMYCVGGGNDTNPVAPVGDLNSTYFASLSATGVGAWMQTTDYPIGIMDQSCITSSSYIYCIGGLVGAPNAIGTTSVYYAPLSPSGIGPWSQTTPFPGAGETSCMASSGYAYCVRAQSNGTSLLGYSEVFAAPLSASGVGNWTESGQVPKNPAGCSASGGYGYCFGGGGCPPGPPFSQCPSSSYYASLSPNGTGTWNTTTDLPTSGYGVYVTADSYEYYFAGDPPYVAHLSAEGIGAWSTTTPYPGGPASCVANGQFIYCIGAAVNDAYFSRIST
jgi:hypothetical protein